MKKMAGETATAAKAELKRDLGQWAAISIVVGTMIGSGVFLVPSTMIQRVGSVPMVFLVWIAAKYIKSHPFGGRNPQNTEKNQ